jgi:hypothetical protein
VTLAELLVPQIFRVFVLRPWISDLRDFLDEELGSRVYLKSTQLSSTPLLAMRNLRTG